MTPQRIVQAACLLVLLSPGSSHGAPRLSVSRNFLALLEKLPYVAERPLAREMRYTYALAHDVKGLAEDPLVVTDEPGLSDMDWSLISKAGS